MKTLSQSFNSLASLYEHLTFKPFGSVCFSSAYEKEKIAKKCIDILVLQYDRNKFVDDAIWNICIPNTL